MIIHFFEKKKSKSLGFILIEQTFTKKIEKAMVN
jgi:hypothetical protein